MAKHRSFYVFKVSDEFGCDKIIVDGLNEKEARRNLPNDWIYAEFECPKIKLLSVHETFFRADAWKSNNNDASEIPRRKRSTNRPRYSKDHR